MYHKRVHAKVRRRCTPRVHPKGAHGRTPGVRRSHPSYAPQAAPITLKVRRSCCVPSTRRGTHSCRHKTALVGSPLSPQPHGPSTHARLTHLTKTRARIRAHRHAGTRRHQLTRRTRHAHERCARPLPRHRCHRNKTLPAATTLPAAMLRREEVHRRRRR